MKHISVLLNESINGLNIKSNGIYLDLTLGRAGHSKEILKKLDKGYLYGFDLDNDAIKESKAVLDKISNRFSLIHSNYKYFDEVLKENHINNVDGILLDLGVSSPQFDNPIRGFSYNFDSPLDMRMDNSKGITAKEIVNTYSLKDLSNLFRNYGEEKDAYKIALNIIKQREIKPINTTFELVDIIKKSKSNYELKKKGHPAKQVFQALRIEVNNELNSLKETLDKAIKYLSPKGRLVVISFHSLEDRIVKQAFNNVIKVIGNRNDDYSLPSKNNLSYKLVNKDVITPSEKELNDNPRSKSAKLRILERIK